MKYLTAFYTLLTLIVLFAFPIWAQSKSSSTSWPSYKPPKPVKLPVVMRDHYRFLFKAGIDVLGNPMEPSKSSSTTQSSYKPPKPVKLSVVMRDHYWFLSKAGVDVLGNPIKPSVSTQNTRSSSTIKISYKTKGASEKARKGSKGSKGGKGGKVFVLAEEPRLSSTKARNNGEKVKGGSDNARKTKKPKKAKKAKNPKAQNSANSETEVTGRKIHKVLFANFVSSASNFVPWVTKIAISNVPTKKSLVNTASSAYKYVSQSAISKAITSRIPATIQSHANALYTISRNALQQAISKSRAGADAIYPIVINISKYTVFAIDGTISLAQTAISKIPSMKSLNLKSLATKGFVLISSKLQIIEPATIFLENDPSLYKMTCIALDYFGIYRTECYSRIRGYILSQEMTEVFATPIDMIDVQKGELFLWTEIERGTGRNCTFILKTDSTPLDVVVQRNEDGTINMKYFTSNRIGRFCIDNEHTVEQLKKFIKYMADQQSPGFLGLLYTTPLIFGYSMRDILWFFTPLLASLNAFLKILEKNAVPVGRWTLPVFLVLYTVCYIFISEWYDSLIYFIKYELFGR